ACRTIAVGVRSTTKFIPPALRYCVVAHDRPNMTCLCPLEANRSGESGTSSVPRSFTCRTAPIAERRDVSTRPYAVTWHVRIRFPQRTEPGCVVPHAVLDVSLLDGSLGKYPEKPERTGRPAYAL